MIVTELAVIEPTAEGLALRERSPGRTVDEIRAAAEASFIAPGEVPEMDLGRWRMAKSPAA